MINLVEYRNKIKEAIKKVYKFKPVLQELCYVQAIHESNLAKSPSRLAIECNNLFGIKDTDRKDYKEYPTWEVLRGKNVRVMARFEKYPSLEAGIEAHKRLMSRDRYVKVVKSKSFKEAAKAILEAGYATDPKYTEKLLNIQKLFVKEGDFK